MTRMSMNEITLNPQGTAIKRFIKQAVEHNLNESPVRYAFEDEWPVHLSRLEAREVLQAVRNHQPDLRNPHGDEHRDMAIREVKNALNE